MPWPTASGSPRWPFTGMWPTRPTCSTGWSSASCWTSRCRIPGTGGPTVSARLARGTRAAALRHPQIFPLLLQRAAVTPGARRTREVVYAALREAGLAEDDVVQMERLLVTAVLGFAASEAGGRFAAHSADQLDADFARLQDILAAAVLAAMERAPRPV